MKKSILVGILLLAISMSLLSQDFSPIVVQKKGLGKSYSQNDIILKRKELANVLMSYPASAKELKTASTYSAIGAGMMGTGALVIGLSSFLSAMQDLDALNSGSGNFSENSTIPFLIGVGLAVAGIPLALIGNSHFVNSIVLYNSQGQTSHRPNMRLDFGIHNSGIGLQLTF